MSEPLRIRLGEAVLELPPETTVAAAVQAVRELAAIPPRTMRRASPMRVGMQEVGRFSDLEGTDLIIYACPEVGDGGSVLLSQAHDDGSIFATRWRATDARLIASALLDAAARCIRQEPAP